MSTVTWLGGGSTTHPTDGAFDTGSNWDSGRVPGSGDDVVLGDSSAPYQVTQYFTSGASYDEVGSLFIGTKAILASGGEFDDYNSITIDNQCVNHGTIGLSYDYFSGKSASTNLQNYGLIDLYSTGLGMATVNYGTINDSQGYSFNIVNDESGNLNILEGGYRDCVLVNNGFFTVENSTIFIDTGSVTSNLSNGDLSGGHWILESGSRVIFDSDLPIQDLGGKDGRCPRWLRIGVPDV